MTYDLTDEQFITRLLWRVANGGGECGERAARIAMERRVANQEFEPCSVAFPCNHCEMCEKEAAR